MSKIILDLCGGTGTWSKPYKDNGYAVYNITLPEFDLNLAFIHIDGCIYFVRKNGTCEKIEAEKVYGILAAPPCTMFSLARTTAKTDRDFFEGMTLVKKCLEIIWFCRTMKGSSLKFWAMENPRGYLRQFLGKPPLTFSPHEYGENYTKYTDLWGYYNIPKKKIHTLTDDEKIRTKYNTRKLPELPPEYIMPKGWNKTAARRSMTSSKFATAFYKANK